VGRVIGSDGNVHYLFGAPNSQLDTNALFKTLNATATHPGLTAEKLKAAVRSKAHGYFYGGEISELQELTERGLVEVGAETLIAKTTEGIQGNAALRDLIAKRGYAQPNAPEFYARAPGRADAFGLTVVQFVDHSRLGELPAAPAITDIMSVWNQRDRAVSHWGGEMKAGVWPVVAAEFAVGGSAAVVNVENLSKATRLLDGLPSHRILSP